MTTYSYFDEPFHTLNLRWSVLITFLLNVDFLKKQGRERSRINARTKKARKYARERNRLPKWRDEEKIWNVYADCPKKMTVDHVVPMCGVKVSGLHVHNNLQYLSEKENSKKSNNFIPYREINGEIIEYYG